MNTEDKDRLVELHRQFRDGMKIGADNVDQIKARDMLLYLEDHGYQGSWDESGVVVKITDKTITVRKSDGSTSRISKEPTRLRRRRVYRTGTEAEAEELRRLDRQERVEEAERRKQDDIASQRKALVERIHNVAVREFAAAHVAEVEALETEITKRFHDCQKCGWPGREDGHGCLRCSDGYR